MFFIRVFFCVLLTFFVLSKIATAQVIEDVYYNWTVFEYDNELSSDGKKCYVTSFPVKKIGNHGNLKRKPYILITRFAKNKKEEVSVYSGYDYKPSSNVHMLIDQEQFKLFTHNDLAWSKTAEIDKKVISKMLNASIIKVRGDSANSTYSVDEYSLKGFGRAYKRMKDICK